MRRKIMADKILYLLIKIYYKNLNIQNAHNAVECTPHMGQKATDKHGK
jgi:hypothetical protein